MLTSPLEHMARDTDEPNLALQSVMIPNESHNSNYELSGMPFMKPMMRNGNYTPSKSAVIVPLQIVPYLNLL